MTTWQQLDLLELKHPRTHGERRMQIALCDLLDKGWLSPGWEFFAIPNGELRTEKTGALLKRMGAKAGIPDLQFLSPTGLAYFLELKWGKQPLTEAQKAFAERQLVRGVPCAVARSYDEALEQLHAWGAIRVRMAA
jgi:hypothetical protein